MANSAFTVGGGPSTGTVSSVAVGVGLTATPSPITTAGTVSVNINAFCQGRLTLTTGVPVTTTDVAAAANIFFTPYKGSYITLFTAGAWRLYTFTERTLAVPAVANQMYDVFIFDNAGTLTLEEIAWANDTTRATAIVLQDGIYCQDGALDRRYLGSFRTRAASQCNDTQAFRHLYNYYNRVAKNLNITDPALSWTYTNPVFQQANNNPANQVDIVQGVAEDIIFIALDAGWNSSVPGGGVGVANGIGIDGLIPINRNRQQSASPNQIGLSVQIFAEPPTTVGRHYYTWLEASDVTGTTTWYGTNYSDNFGLTGYCMV